ncbi:MAG: PQQ-dependent sugar dehydrogenase [Phycisphaerales bacterium]|nr:PQQ-dependent sugar dehydrogenase [Phycisphaerales bacterium]
MTNAMRAINSVCGVLVLGASALALPCGSTLGDPLPDIPQCAITVTLQSITSALESPPQTPTDIVAVPDGSGRLFVATIQGIVLVLYPDGTISELVDTTNPNTLIDPARYGMISVEVHPGFTDPESPGFGKVYTLTTEAGGSGVADFGGFGFPHQDVIHEWMIDGSDPNVVDPSTQREILRIGQKNGDHNVSDMVFLDDQTMLIAVGDGRNTPAGQPENGDGAQDISTIFGSVIRIDPVGVIGTLSANGEYSIPTDNPFYSVPGAVREIYAYGFRSPYRMNRDPVSGQIFIGDVGQLTIEELTIIQPGGNHGWNVHEGSFLFDRDTYGVCTDPMPIPGLVEPIAEYDHDDGRSIVAGHTYRGAALPTLTGLHVFADFLGGPTSQFRGRLMITNPQVGGAYALPVSGMGDELPFFIYSVSVDEDGELLIAGNTVDGKGTILRVIAATSCLGDVTGAGGMPDGVVDVDDLNAILSAWGTMVPSGSRLDLANDDGVIDVDDLNVVLSNWAVTCP